MATYCNNCGQPLPEDSRFCGSCGMPSLPAQAPVPAYYAPAPAAGPVYAGFWWRFLAYLIDSTIISVVSGVILVPLLLGLGLGAGLSRHGFPVGLIAVYLFFMLLSLVGTFLYYALLESSGWQGTPGKKVLGIKVVDQNGQRITFGRAAGRTAGKYLSGLILGLGFLLAAFDERKQALHDKLAGTLVTRS